ncbi:sulfotransferase family protein [Thermodesulfobacterium hydrogeniphilum]|uniref:sulfotransferase family protein n=1 Tax=Thermodesulfobacterium hydrogeniphilum TaxID=161156 RepID=UPI000571F9DD|nr:sulfotransferase [Thermodesulfobacterium hydrogeniphilum]
MTSIVEKQTKAIQNNGRVKVIYIAGEGRSGSTLLERILGQHPKIFAAGELKHIWERSFIENQLCSCGKSFYDCDFWKLVRKRFHEYYGEIDYKSVIEAFKKTCRIRHYLFRKNLNNKHSKFINGVYLALYKAISDVSGKEFVIDASKHPVFAHILAQNPAIKLYVIHLIRDPRAVAYSWQKKKIRPEITDRVEYMPRYSIVRSAVSWGIVNKISYNLSEFDNIKYILIKYKDLIFDPKNTLLKLYKFLNIKENFESLFLDEKTIFFSKNHTVAGNPIRFKVGRIQLEMDNEWKEKMPRYKQLLVYLLVGLMFSP